MPGPSENQGLGHSIGEIIDRLTTLVHEEIELAKAEMATAFQNLLRGSVAAILGGVFAIFGLLLLVEGVAWLLNDLFNAPWIGFFIVAVALFVCGGLAAGVALRKIKKGAQLAPEQAIYEARVTTEALRQTEGTPPQELDVEAIEETPDMAGSPSVADVEARLTDSDRPVGSKKRWPRR